jgi:protein-S-isoprenylcysteine O-methyltransferase Ste14
VDASPVTAVLVNLAVLSVFALQHSVMARPGFKRVWTRIVPEPIERATYVLFSTLAMWLVYWGWQPIGGTVWAVESTAGFAALSALQLAGFGLVLYATLLISHFDLFGVRQVWLYFRGVPYSHLPFATPSLYKRMRHPLYLGWFVAFWATPTMSLGHVMFASVCSAYILVALVFEERDLVAHFGERYLRYKREVPAFVPVPGRRADATADAQTATG